MKSNQVLALSIVLMVVVMDLGVFLTSLPGGSGASSGGSGAPGDPAVPDSSLGWRASFATELNGSTVTIVRFDGVAWSGSSLDSIWVVFSLASPVSMASVSQRSSDGATWVQVSSWFSAFASTTYKVGLLIANHYGSSGSMAVRFEINPRAGGAIVFTFLGLSYVYRDDTIYLHHGASWMDEPVLGILGMILLLALIVVFVAPRVRRVRY